MEVHHHPHIEKKGFKEYFLEFLMIFLAVTLGFLAESLREHIADTSKEKEYLSSLFDELKYDTTQYHLLLKQINILDPVLDSCYVNVKKAPQYNYTLLAKWNTPVNELGPRYKPTLPTIEQLKSSGNLRLLQSKEIVKKIMEYESFIFGTYMDLYNDVQNAATQVYRLEDQLCDYTDFISKLDSNMRHVSGKLSTESSELYAMPIVIKDPEKLNELANSFVNFKANNYGYTTALNRAVKISTELLKLIDAKYHFDKKDK
jgi:hypothetical protein